MRLRDKKREELILEIEQMDIREEMLLSQQQQLFGQETPSARAKFARNEDELDRLRRGRVARINEVRRRRWGKK